MAMPDETVPSTEPVGEVKTVKVELEDGMKAADAPLPDSAKLAADAPPASPEEQKPPEEPRLPLFMADSRFALLEKTILTQFQNKFVKLFRKIKPGHAYKSNQEIASWLASFVFQNLRCTHEAFKTGPEDLQIFMFVLKALASKSELMPVAKTGEEVAGALKEAADPATQPQVTAPAEVQSPASTPTASQEPAAQAGGQTA